MTNESFELLLSGAVKAYGTEYIDYSTVLDTPHRFSRAFERKMKRLINAPKKPLPINAQPKRLLKRAVIIAIAAVLLALLSTGALAFGDKIWSFVTEIFSTHTDVSVGECSEAPTSFERVYEITDIPCGFTLTYQNDRDSGEPWLISEYYAGEERIIFTQYLKESYDIALDTEGREIFNIFINDCAGFGVDMEGYIYLTWDEGGYVFSLEGNIDKDLLANLANSTKIKK